GRGHRPGPADHDVTGLRPALDRLQPARGPARRSANRLTRRACHRRRIGARITEIIPRGEFATWRAARAVGDYDLNTFLIRADPLDAAPGLQPGMTVSLRR